MLSEPDFFVHLLCRQIGGEFGILRYLGYRKHKMESRLVCTWSDPSCDHMSLCDCDLNVLCPGLNFRFTISRWFEGVRRLNSTLYMIGLSRVAANFRMRDGLIVRVDMSEASVYTQLRLNLLPMSNMVRIPSYFARNIIPVEMPQYFPHKLLGKIAREWDVRVFQSFVSKQIDYDLLQRDVWQSSRYSELPGHSKDAFIPSLRVLAARRASMYNQAFGGYEADPVKYSYVRSALEGMMPTKMIDQVTSYAANTRYVNQYAAELKPLVPEALDIFYDMLGTRKEFGKHAWDESFESFKQVRADTSSGIDAPPRDGRQTLFTFPGSDAIYKASVNGKKYEQFDRGFNMVLDYCEQAKSKVPTMLALAFVLKAKNEYFAKYDAFGPAAYSKYSSKFRYFNIGYIDTHLMERHLFGPSLKLERGNVIQIGHRWWHGGADRLARKLKGKKLGDGDLTSCDQTMHRILMEIFFATRHLYFNFVLDQRFRYMNLLKALVPALMYRVTNVFAHVWLVIMAGVASGKLITSHIDSWIVGFMWCLFLAYQRRMASPFVKIMITKMLIKKLIEFMDYGDDHINGVDEAPEYAPVRKLVNEENFGLWCAKFFNVTIKDRRDGLSLETVPSETGGIVSPGVVFLKRYFILRNWIMSNGPEYVPYRPAYQYSAKIIFGKEAKPRTLYDVMLSCIGNAYDTYGTNPVAYAMNRYFFYRIAGALKLRGKSPSALMSQILRNKLPEDIIAFQRKGAMTVKDLYNGFPTLAELRVRHSVDRSYTDNLMEDITGHLVFE